MTAAAHARCALLTPEAGLGLETVWAHARRAAGAPGLFAYGPYDPASLELTAKRLAFALGSAGADVDSGRTELLLEPERPVAQGVPAPPVPRDVELGALAAVAAVAWGTAEPPATFVFSGAVRADGGVGPVAQQGLFEAACAAEGAVPVLCPAPGPATGARRAVSRASDLQAGAGALPQR